MEEILKAIQKAVKQIANEIKFCDFGYSAGANSSGDRQLKLDVLSDEIITQTLVEVKSIKSLISEEKEDELLLNKDAKFIVCYDPLDGSSLVDVNFAVGSIFAIYENELKSSNLIASVYSVYGPRLELVVCQEKPKLYRLNKALEFEFAKDLVLNEKGKLNATGATQKGWSDEHRNLIKSLFDDGYRLRYSGAMVSDLHQILLKGGGLFSYPATTDAKNGKLRVVFEVLPFAYIFEKAGGSTTDGKLNSLMDIKINEIHQTTPCYFGSKFEIKRVLNG